MVIGVNGNHFLREFCMSDKKLGLDFLKSLFLHARHDHPGRRGSTNNPRGRGHGKKVSGDSKYHRKMVARGVK